MGLGYQQLQLKYAEAGRQLEEAYRRQDEALQKELDDWSGYHTNKNKLEALMRFELRHNTTNMSLSKKVKALTDRIIYKISNLFNSADDDVVKEIKTLENQYYGSKNPNKDTLLSIVSNNIKNLEIATSTYEREHPRKIYHDTTRDSIKERYEAAFRKTNTQ